MEQFNSKVVYLNMEKYKNIPSMYLYECSNYGNIRRIGSKSNLKPCIKNGYKAVSLWVEGKQYPRYVHRLVAESFIGDCSNMSINHIDGNKLNNSLDNIEIVTASENMIHAYNNGLRSFTDKQRIGLLKSRQKKVLDMQTGIFFDSLADACKSLNENYSAVRKRIMRKSNNMRFVYV
jgi:hypothetical protein